MATFTSICLAMAIFVAASNAAPSKIEPDLVPLKVPDECKGKGFCSIKPEGYDEMQEKIDKFLSATFLEQNMDDRIAAPEVTEELSPKDDWHNCPFRKTVKESTYLYSHSNDSAPDMIIQSKYLRQRIEIIECANDKISPRNINSSEECFTHLDLESFNMKSVCQTSTAKRSLYVVDFKTQQPMQKSYDVPCCCTCQIFRSS